MFESDNCAATILKTITVITPVYWPWCEDGKKIQSLEELLYSGLVVPIGILPCGA